MDSGPETQVLRTALTRSPSGRLLFPSWHFPLQLLRFVERRVAAVGQVKSECGLRRSAHGRTRAAVRACVRTRGRVCASLYFGSRSSSVSLTVKNQIHLGRFSGREAERQWSGSSCSSGGSPLTIRVRPSALIDARQSVPQAAVTAGSSAGAIRVKKKKKKRAFLWAQRRCGRPGRGDASRHRSIEQTEH